MRCLASIRCRSPLVGLAVVALLLALPAAAPAQVNPLWDHYKVYFVNPPIPYPVPGPPVTLRDQFTTWTHQVEVLERFMNPTEKQHLPGGQTFPVNDPMLHYTWWRISPQSFSATVTAINQFGDHTLNVFAARYLLNPALKNQPGQPPPRNHYKCYDCQGPPVNVQVMMNDQYGPWQATVTVPRFFCNPTEKTVGDPGAGQTYPILDPNQHYVCYEFQPPDNSAHTAVLTDQFVADRGVQLQPSDLICVPTYKSGVTPTAPGTWGRIKVLYR